MSSTNTFDISAEIEKIKDENIRNLVRWLWDKKTWIIVLIVGVFILKIFTGGKKRIEIGV